MCAISCSLGDWCMLGNIFINIQSLHSTPQASHTASDLPYNKGRNRFIDIFPCELKPKSFIGVARCDTIYNVTDDYNRVKLNKIPNNEGSDYINASFISVK